ncbi:MAG TPA: ABC transporter ATP-binding protein [Pirellulaceae bacterium]|nr:ABC transporter ATP-binding protein [Pirellulaceae bacterium]HMO93031.1 ABC transporter ATP-binding protein [Pirellulaceae bacterium]HMP69661.1 ABC transporter ATP-binding protein [Pirellulaceae bacterium]
MITVHKLKKSYGDRVAVNGIDFDIQRGETYGFLGPNGAGKTTTISMLVGLIAPDSGSIRVAGGDPFQLKTRIKLGVAPQSLSLYDNLSGTDNLRFFGSLYQLSGNHLRHRTDWALKLAGLTDRAKDKVATYSGGMKRRLNIAVALLHDPEVLLLDEPTVGVDPQSRNHILETIGELSRQGLTIIYTTHYMEEAERLCHRIAIMDYGTILANETKDQLLAKYGGDATVKALIAANPLGLELPGQITNGHVEFRSARPVDELSALHQQGVEFSEVHIAKPNLENVFLNLTGRTLRD